MINMIRGMRNDKKYINDKRAMKDKTTNNNKNDKDV